MRGEPVMPEIDRYVAAPGQALAYALGRLEIERMRTEARTRLGERFDIRAFHDTVLASGALSLPILDRAVRSWTEDVAAS